MNMFGNRINNQFATLTVFNVGWIAPISPGSYVRTLNVH